MLWVAQLKANAKALSLIDPKCKQIHITGKRAAGELNAKGDVKGGRKCFMAFLLSFSTENPKRLFCVKLLQNLINNLFIFYFTKHLNNIFLFFSWRTHLLHPFFIFSQEHARVRVLHLNTFTKQYPGLWKEKEKGRRSELGRSRKTLPPWTRGGPSAPQPPAGRKTNQWHRTLCALSLWYDPCFVPTLNINF